MASNHLPRASTTSFPPAPNAVPYVPNRRSAALAHRVQEAEASLPQSSTNKTGGKPPPLRQTFI